MSILKKYIDAQKAATQVAQSALQGTDKYVGQVADGKTALTTRSAGPNASIYSPVPGTTDSNSDYLNKAFQQTKL